ncbi:MAG TPA: hypothetical protein PK504_10585 [Ferruginibacter sp.]|nr:hypothetical protein [Ferruginibacter sp.]HRE63596.1 hypothetical protein [Ferruginibacter sp.]
MKRQKILLKILFASFLFSSCNFSKGVKKDLSTGLSASYNGLSIEDIYLSSNGTKIAENKITLGEKVEIIVTGVSNYVVKDERVYPACSIVLKDKTGKELLNLADALSDRKNGFAKNEASTLTASINTGEPMIAGDTYHFSATFFDKLKPENVINAEVNIVAK